MANKQNKSKGFRPKGWNKTNKGTTQDYSKDKGKGNDVNIAESGESCAPNDLSWYVVDEQILNDAARIPYSIPVGMPYTRRPTFSNSAVTETQFDDAISGIMVMHVMPMLGLAYNAADPVNVAANSIYQNVRSKISGSRPYDAVDMMIYLGAMDSLYCYVTWLTRLFGTVYTYHQANRYLSKALVEAQGVDYDDLVSNIAQFRASINLQLAKVRALYLPAILPIFKRHSWLFSHYYIEGDSEKDQIYCYAPEGVHAFKYDSDGAGMLESYRLLHPGNSKLTTSGLLNLLSALINPIYADEDFNRISGDMLKAYEGNVFTLTEIPDISTIQLIHNEEVLLQFKNAKCMYVGSADGSKDRFIGSFFTYKQDVTKTWLEMAMPKDGFEFILNINGAYNTFDRVTSASSALDIACLASCMMDWSKDTLLTSPHHDVTPGENMINSRLALAFDIVPDSSVFYGARPITRYAGSEWPLYWDLWTFHRDINTNALTLFERHYSRTFVVDESNFNTVRQLTESQWPIISAYKYMPEMAIITHNGSNIVYNAGRSIFEVDNYALVSSPTIGGMHNAALLGEYNIPKLAIGR